jgi:hypothetical protein
MGNGGNIFHLSFAIFHLFICCVAEPLSEPQPNGTVIGNNDEMANGNGKWEMANDKWKMISRSPVPLFPFPLLPYCPWHR